VSEALSRSNLHVAPTPYCARFCSSANQLIAADQWPSSTRV